MSEAIGRDGAGLIGEPRRCSMTVLALERFGVDGAMRHDDLERVMDVVNIA